MAQTSKRYDRWFKAAAAKVVLEGERTVADPSHELGIKDATLGRWAKEYEEMGEVKRLYFFVETFLDSHSGFDRDDIQGWLNLLSVAMNPPEDKMEKAAMVFNRAVRNPKRSDTVNSMRALPVQR